MAFITKVSETPLILEINRIIRVWMILAEVLSDIEDPEGEVAGEENTQHNHRPSRVAAPIDRMFLSQSRYPN